MRTARNAQSEIGNRKTEMKMGLTGLEPVTLRLSSACSNQLSYRPAAAQLFKGANRKWQLTTLWRVVFASRTANN